MSGDWIKMRVNLWDDPRVGRICDLTGSKEASVVGALYWLWATADQHTENGILPGLSLQQIDRKTGVKGFAAALVDVRWLEDHPDGVCIARFEEHNGKSAKKRLETARRVAKHRSGNQQETRPDEIGNAESVTTALAREEKRREEKKEPPQPPRGEGRFAEFWTAWPKSTRKGGKPECLRVWQAKGLDAEADAVLAHVRSMAATEGWTKSAGEFVPAPVVYLRGRRWDGAELVNGAEHAAQPWAGAL